MNRLGLIVNNYPVILYEIIKNLSYQDYLFLCESYPRLKRIYLPYFNSWLTQSCNVRLEQDKYWLDEFKQKYSQIDQYKFKLQKKEKLIINYCVFNNNTSKEQKLVNNICVRDKKNSDYLIKNHKINHELVIDLLISKRSKISFVKNIYNISKNICKNTVYSFLIKSIIIGYYSSFLFFHSELSNMTANRYNIEINDISQICHNFTSKRVTIEDKLIMNFLVNRFTSFKKYIMSEINKFEKHTIIKPTQYNYQLLKLY